MMSPLGTRPPYLVRIGERAERLLYGRAHSGAFLFERLEELRSHRGVPPGKRTSGFRAVNKGAGQ
jgi:hypothetical protein